jgi:hypothetical protein
MEFVIGILILGALFGFLFSKKGHEKEGAIEGAKTSCGCLLAFTIILIGAFIFFVFMAAGLL